MRILACVSTVTVLLLAISAAPAFDKHGGEQPYAVTLENCAPAGSACGGCYTVLIPCGVPPTPGGCPSGFRCDAAGCLGGTLAYNACTSGATSTGNCTSNGDNQLSTCTGCQTWPGGCVAGSVPATCTGGTCGAGVGTPLIPGIALLCP
jgi:hypothetical protein